VDSGTTLKKGTVISQVKGLAVYTNISAREVRLPLFEKDQALKGGRLKVTFTPKDHKAPAQVAYAAIP